MDSSSRSTDKRLTKGRRTRTRLVEEALRLFAERGYAGVGIREVAAAARTNVASIAFHFSGKQGLYGAVVEHVAGELAGLHREVLAEAARTSDTLGEDPGQRVERIAADLAARLMLSNRSQWMTLLLQREFITPTEFFPHIYETAVRPTLHALDALARQASPRTLCDRDAKTLAFSLFIMTSSFQRNKNTFLRFLEKDEYSKDDVETISRLVARFVRNGLTADRDPT